MLIILLASDRIMPRDVKYVKILTFDFIIIYRGYSKIFPSILNHMFYSISKD